MPHLGGDRRPWFIHQPGLPPCVRAAPSAVTAALADANEVRDWRICADFAQVLMGIARDLYRDESFGVELSETVLAVCGVMRSRPSR